VLLTRDSSNSLIFKKPKTIDRPVPDPDENDLVEAAGLPDPEQEPTDQSKPLSVVSDLIEKPVEKPL
jgi:hypothetical protein